MEDMRALEHAVGSEPTTERTARNLGVDISRRSWDDDCCVEGRSCAWG